MQITEEYISSKMQWGKNTTFFAVQHDFNNLENVVILHLETVYCF